MIELFIPGQPQGKERSRSRIVTGKGGRQFTSHYTPSKTRKHEQLIESYGINAMQGAKPLSGPVSMDLFMVFEIPKSWPNWKAEMALKHLILPTTKPDSDNVEKSIKDGLNGVVWVDDCQVVKCQKVKVYGPRPGVRVRVHPLPEHPAQITRKDLMRNDDQGDLLSA